MVERMVGVSSSFPSSLAEEDITVELPLAQDFFDAATERIVTGPDATQSLQCVFGCVVNHADSLVRETSILSVSGARRVRTDTYRPT